MSGKRSFEKKPKKSNETSRQKWQRRTKYYAQGNTKEKLQQIKELKKNEKKIEKLIKENANPNSFYDKYFKGELDDELENDDNAGFKELLNKQQQAPLKKSIRTAHEERKEIIKEKKKELEQRKLEEAERIKKRKQKMEEKKVLLKKTRKGQPIMDNIMNKLLKDIQNKQ